MPVQAVMAVADETTLLKSFSNVQETENVKIHERSTSEADHNPAGQLQGVE
jgi:hypothetical protein